MVYLSQLNIVFFFFRAVIGLGYILLLYGQNRTSLKLSFLATADEDGTQGPICQASGINLQAPGVYWNSKEHALSLLETGGGIFCECIGPITTATSGIHPSAH